MLSRRKFLQSNVAGLAFPLAGSVAKAAGPQSGTALPESTQELSSPPIASAKRDYWNDWPLYLTAKMNEARARRKAALASIRTDAQVRERGDMIRQKVWELIGGQLEKTPLNPRTTGDINWTTYRIIKVIFESQPDVYVTAHLYLPKAGKPPFPGILAPLGHTEEGKAYRNYQYVYQTLAQNGFVVLAFDPFGQGERLQYLDPRTGKSRYGPTGEHSQAGRPLLLLGATFAQYRVWDGIRALDYLTSRPEVDPERIGCTGHSGGGTMTMYLAALEPRIKVAVEVEGNSENLAGPDYDPPGAVADAEQNLVGSLATGIDRADLLWAFASKPLLLCYTPQDGGTTYSPVYENATREIFEELKTAYRIMGAQEKVQLFASPLPHDFDFFNRRATYAWFNRWLKKSDSTINEASFQTVEPELLNCTSTGQVLTSLGGRSLVQINSDRLRALRSNSSSNPPLDAQAARLRVQESLRRLLAFPHERAPLQSAVLSTNTLRGLAVEEFEFRSEPEIRIPGWFVKRAQATSPLPTILYVSENGKEQVWDESSWAETLAPRGYAICAIDLRGLGIGAPRSPRAGPRFYEGEHLEEDYAWASLTLGKPVLGQRVWDFMRCLDYLEARSEVDRTRIHVVGVQGAGLAAMVGAVLDDRVQSILLDKVIATLRSIVESEEYTLPLSWFVDGFLREFDLPDLVGTLAPRRCWLLNAAGARGDTLPEETMQKGYRTAVDRYSVAARPGALQFLVRPKKDSTSAVISWLESS